MAQKNKVRSLRVSPQLDARITSYALSTNQKEADAIRDLIEKGLACESLSIFATPVGSLIRDVVEAEFNLLRAEFDERNDELEDRLARVCSRGTKASLHTAMMLTDVSRAIVPAWRNANGEGIWRAYARAGGELQAGKSYAEAKASMRK